MSIKSQKSSRQQEILLKQNFLKKSTPNKSQPMSYEPTLEAKTDNYMQNITQAPLAPIQISQPQSQPQVNNNLINEKQIMEKNKQLLKSILKPIRKQIQELQTQKGDSHYVQKVQETQNQIQNLSNFESMVPKNQLEQYQALINKLQNQVNDLQTQVIENDIKEKQQVQEYNKQEQLREEQKQTQIRDHIQKIDFFQIKKAFMKRLGGEFDYDGMIEEIEDIGNEVEKVNQTLKISLNEDKFDISDRNFDQEIQTLSMQKQIGVLDDLKQRYKINLKNYVPQKTQKQVQPKPDLVKKNNYLDQIRTVPQQANPDMKLQFQNYEPVLNSEKSQTQNNEIKQDIINDQIQNQNVKLQNEKIEQYHDQVKNLLENQMKMTSQQQLQIQLLTKKLEDNTQLNQKQIQEILQKQTSRFIENQAPQSIQESQHFNYTPIIQKNLIQQVQKEEDQYIQEKSELKISQPLMNELGLQLTKQKIGEMLFDIKYQEKEKQFDNKLSSLQQEYQQTYQQPNFIKEPIHQQNQVNYQNDLMENFVKLASNMIEKLTNKIETQIQEKISPQQAQNSYQQPQYQNPQIFQQVQQFDLNLDSLTPVIQPHFASKNILKELLQENMSDMSSQMDGSISESIFQINQNSSKSDGQISGPQYNILNNQIQMNDNLLKSIISDSELSQY